MQVELARKYGFCFGVKRAISIAEKCGDAQTFGPLIHNQKEIDRLSRDFSVSTVESFDHLDTNKPIIIRTHGIQKSDLQNLQNKDANIIDATCPFVTKPQMICEEMSKEGYRVVIFGDKEHPEVKGVMSYSHNKPIVILSIEELSELKLGQKIALVSQTTRKIENFLEIASYLISKFSEVRVFNTICNATFENQEAAHELSKKSDIMIIVGGKNSSNTKQLLRICKNNCAQSYLIEDENEIESSWFEGKKRCGVSAGASTPKWIIDKVVAKISDY